MRNLKKKISEIIVLVVVIHCFQKNIKVIRIEFERTLTSRSTLKKLKKYEFDFHEKDIEKGRKADSDKPHFCKEKKKAFEWFALYNEAGNLKITMFHSYDKFIEIKSDGKQTKLKKGVKE